MSFAGIKHALYEILSEPGPGGTLSWGRCAASLSLLAGIFWVSKVVLRTHAIPDLGGVSLWATAPYTANKISTAAQAFSNAPVNATTPQPQPALVQQPVQPNPAAQAAQAAALAAAQAANQQHQ